jgi:hypothetical protein
LYSGLCTAKLAFYLLSHSSRPFCSSYFEDRVLWTICQGWLWTTVLPISASQVTRITDISHQHPAHSTFFFFWQKMGRKVFFLFNKANSPMFWLQPKEPLLLYFFKNPNTGKAILKTYYHRFLFKTTCSLQKNKTYKFLN